MIAEVADPAKAKDRAAVVGAAEGRGAVDGAVLGAQQLAASDVNTMTLFMSVSLADMASEQTL
jgi:hypothetical protein